MNFILSDESAMKKFGATLGRLVRGGECIMLVGDVGAGKTTFTKGLAVGMGIDDTVQSPTFTINRTYDAPTGLHLSHYDFYRLDDPGIMMDELSETLQSDSVVVIEWGDVVTDIIPSDSIIITFTALSDTERSCDVQAGGSHSQTVLEELA